MLKLINAGLGRTGTTSLKAALDRLGLGPSFHMFDIVGDAGRLQQWERVVCDGADPDWAALFAGYGAAVDGPCAVHYQQIGRAFPDARTILTVRDAESWYRSTHDTLYQFALRSAAHPPQPGSAQARLFRITTTMVWDGLFEGRFADKDHAIDVYHRHNEDVVRTLGAGNVLVYDVSQGWEPLCDFLGADVPAEAFPRTNDTASMRRRVARAAGAAPAPAAG
ncbi:sulfotransferase family protein [Streptomyces parvulus]|uniref:Sulfotransferase family protein n=1 Tax=Streptomyces parvulus TaxID=146923 RepID=A0A369UYC6_9ACTN|nr:sulfotransferase family protein [Streptomyces parvulus]RDD84590.1 sulfotransferase family protein [Streptomyces parvulus]